MTEQTNRPRVHPERKRRVRSALKFFSITAWVTGIALLVLTARMIAEYIFHVEMPAWATMIAILHGWCYMAFVIATFMLGTKSRFAPTWWIVTILGGVVPFLSFYVERVRRREITERFQLDEPDVPIASS
ncbi:DUF3817 domain-containing protein [Corynebacterium uterequi]|uniref:Integral membrane protein n=1 Tax=Corynebacterium uterequi TaxID=1072256 RepID=A0A0G3HIJ0_9CORY|nr:DUF3817 domain-containing protein [Corynebacterium uterequi]AKK11748.1 integral membrane protein [Corynebacterium uterequi]